MEWGELGSVPISGAQLLLVAAAQTMRIVAAAAALELAQALLGGVEWCEVFIRVSPYLGVVAVAQPTGHSVTFAAITAGDEAAPFRATFGAAHRSPPTVR